MRLIFDMALKSILRGLQHVLLCACVIVPKIKCCGFLILRPAARLLAVLSYCHGNLIGSARRNSRTIYLYILNFQDNINIMTIQPKALASTQIPLPKLCQFWHNNITKRKTCQNKYLRFFHCFKTWENVPIAILIKLFIIMSRQSKTGVEHSD